MSWKSLMRTGHPSTLGDVALGDALHIPWEGHGMIHCPAHDDRAKSLSWNWANGKLLLHCFAGCTWEEIRAACRS